ncbi:MAG: short-chain fatty acid transporter [Chitinophagaceae bacterium]|nr:MAG: short-chain fatty acid transporter [Chitinophagaceae bacterium]
MGFKDTFITLFRRFLPMPFSIAVVLSFLTFFLALLITTPDNGNTSYAVSVLQYIPEVATYWETGFWELLAFTMQMMLVLVLGHVLALTPAVDKAIAFFLKYCKTTSLAAALVAFLTIIVTLFNWGLGLIFGAVFAKKVGEHARQNNIPLYYPVVGAAAYSGFMVWHGGLSGSAPLIVSDANHFLVDQMGVMSMSETIFSGMNLFSSALLLLCIPAFYFLLGKRSIPKEFKVPESKTASDTKIHAAYAEKIDFSYVFGRFFGLLFILFAFYKAFILPEQLSLDFLNFNFINFTLFGLCIFFHGNFFNFVKAAENSIKSSAGVMIQFPLYAGIMGIMKYSGLMIIFSEFFVSISNEYTFPIFTLFSAGIVNVFVPSGGGQWAVQGPIIIEAAGSLGIPLPKAIMALVYGDQLTNMIQPIWALPLLGITGLKVQEILPYTLMTMLIGTVIFILSLLIF